jgi:hypothetical protein
MWLIAGFAALGFLIGNLLGLSASPVVQSTISLLFALLGGSIVVFLHKLSPADRRVAGQLITSLAMATLVGTFVGIVISERRLLSPTIDTRGVDNKYLRGLQVSEVNAIDLQYDSKAITADEAYRKLRVLIAEAAPTR